MKWFIYLIILIHRSDKGEEKKAEENHTVIATAKGYFTSKGGVLEAPGKFIFYQIS